MARKDNIFQRTFLRGEAFPISKYLISWFVYGLVFCVNIPLGLSRFFSQYSFLLFAVLLLVFFAGFSLPEKRRWPVVYAVVMVLFALPLVYRWTSGYSDAAIIGGLLPYKDGFYYYNGARLLLNGQSLPVSSMQAAWRPLFPGFLASLMALVGGNLKWVLALLVGLIGLCIAFSSEIIHRWMGKWPAVLYISFLFLYMQKMIGYLKTETLGLAVGCLGFVLIWQGAQNGQMKQLVYGLVVLMTAVSIRAGAFFVFPLLVLWMGWRFRGSGHFSWRAAGIGGLTVLLSFLFFNWVYPRLVVVPGGMANGNFAFTIYGQVIGGASWHQAIADLKTTDPALVYRIAWDEFLRHPYSLLIATAKSYRDFFMPSSLGIFSFISSGGRTMVDILLWSASLLGLLWGIVCSIRTWRAPTSSLLLAVWVGIFLSIPFLPPIDGGRRFHASTVPFFFALAVLSLAGLSKKKHDIPAVRNASGAFAAVLSGGLLLMTALVPVALQRLTQTPDLVRPDCSTDQVNVAFEVMPGSFVDVVSERVEDCGTAPQVCQEDFLVNSTEKDVDDFYQRLAALSGEMQDGMRIVPANDLLQEGFRYYVGPAALMGGSNLKHTVIGCAREIQTMYQGIYVVESVISEGE